MSAPTTELVRADVPQRRAPRSAARRVLNALAVFLLAVLATLTILVAYVGFSIVSAAHTQDLTHTDALVVLGAAQFDGRPSPVLANRASHALSLYRAGVAPVIVTVGANQPGDRFTEAGSARTWLLAHGVPASALVSVPEGHDTLSSMQALAQVAATHQWDTITVVTDPAHASRSARIANDLGLVAHVAPTQSGPGSALTLHYVMREIASTLHYWAFERPYVHTAGELV